MITRQDFFKAVEVELEKARVKHGVNHWGRHEFHSILQEEYEEVWDDIKANAPSAQLNKEIIQVVAVCLHYLETGDRTRGEHPPLDLE
jgi:hypothetical protein